MFYHHHHHPIWHVSSRTGEACCELLSGYFTFTLLTIVSTCPFTGSVITTVFKADLDELDDLLAFFLQPVLEENFAKISWILYQKLPRLFLIHRQSPKGRGIAPFMRAV